MKTFKFKNTDAFITLDKNIHDIYSKRPIPLSDNKGA